MGYFPNGSAGMDYEERYCDHCLHQGSDEGGGGCWVWMAHMLRNYDDCNNADSILHMLIPRSADGLDNEKCRMFVEKELFPDMSTRHYLSTKDEPYPKVP
jgi:hypothetical protein